jgi:proteic killer suppression protein
MTAMRLEFANRKLERLFVEGHGAEKLPEGIYRAFVAAILFIQQINDERDLYAIPGLRPEKLTGKRKGQSSIRLNKQFRLIYTIFKDANGNLVWIIDLEDYH